jgi:hypothetical protein
MLPSVMKPWCWRIAQTSAPERVRNLPNRNLNLSDEDFRMRAPRYFRRRSCFEEECQRLDQVGSCFFNRRALTCNVKLRTQSDKAVVLTFDNCSQALNHILVYPVVPESLFGWVVNGGCVNLNRYKELMRIGITVREAYVHEGQEIGIHFCDESSIHASLRPELAVGGECPHSVGALANFGYGDSLL